MAQFIRFMRGETMEQAISNAQADLERGYSFQQYMLFDSREEAQESDTVVYYGADMDTLVETESGQFAFALDGLCGYEYDGDDVSDFPYGRHFDYVARYEGRYVGPTDCNDGDVFRASRLIGVEAVAATAIA